MLGEIHVAPGLLIAMPQLRDPNFDRSVVLMIEHRQEGSFGLVINRPTRTPIGDLLKSIDVDWQGKNGEVAWSGGPVQPETGWILHEHVDGLDGLGTREILPGLFITSAPVPWLHRIGARPRITVATVITFGRSRPTAPSRTASTRSAWSRRRPPVLLSCHASSR